MRPQLVSIQINGRVTVYAIKLNSYPLSLPIRRSMERLAVPSNSTGKYPSPAPLGLSFSGLLSMLQSCGRSTARQDASANEEDSAPAGSARVNFHPPSASTISLGVFAVLATLIEAGAKQASDEARTIREKDWNFMRTSFVFGHCRPFAFADDAA